MSLPASRRWLESAIDRRYLHVRGGKQEGTISTRYDEGQRRERAMTTRNSSLACLLK